MPRGTAWRPNLVSLEFLAMGLAGVQFGYVYYTGKYSTLGGELYVLKRACKGTGVFNPKKLRELPLASLEVLAGMKAELPEVIRNVKQPLWRSFSPG
jgi:hypothetical protein